MQHLQMTCDLSLTGAAGARQPLPEGARPRSAGLKPIPFSAPPGAGERGGSRCWVRSYWCFHCSWPPPVGFKCRRLLQMAQASQTRGRPVWRRAALTRCQWRATECSCLRRCAKTVAPAGPMPNAARTTAASSALGGPPAEWNRAAFPARNSTRRRGVVAGLIRDGRKAMD